LIDSFALGVSRSATIVLAYLMKYHHNTLEEAYFYLVGKRPQVFPNEGFLLQLIRYENDLIQSREIKPDHSNINEENPIETLNEFENKQKIDV
jgi:protein-tyrosine phosphatase